MSNNFINKNLEEEITRIEEEIRESDQYKLTWLDFLENYNIIEFALATMVGFALNKAVSNLIDDTVHPVVDNVLRQQGIDEILIFNTPIDISEFIANLIYIGLILFIVFLIFKFILSSYTRENVIERQRKEKQEINYELYNLLLLNKNLQALNRIENTLGNIATNR